MNIQETFTQALGHHQAGRLAEAESIYRRILQDLPNHADTLHLLGILSHQTGNAGLAIDLIQRAIAVQGPNAVFCGNLGSAYGLAGKHREAIEAFEQSLRFDPTLPQTHHNLGIAFLTVGNVEEAAAHFRETIRLQPDHADAHYRLSLALQKQEQQLASKVGVQENQPRKSDDKPAFDANPEVARRVNVIAKRETDVERWSNTSQLDTAWNQRAKLAADLLPAGAVVMDLGCGSMALEQLLPAGCRYVPCDVVRRDERTLVCDFNRGEFPPRGEATHLTILGVLEYIYDPIPFLKRLRDYDRPIVLSYNPKDLSPQLNRPGLGWVNHFDWAGLIGALEEAGFTVTLKIRIDAGQVLLRLSPAAPAPIKTKKILVLSAMNQENFGDRLGYHTLNGILPADALVRNSFFDFTDSCKLTNPMTEDIDLVVLGIGNSLFGPMLTEELIRVVEQVPTVGIFGTQYPQYTNAGRLRAVVERLHRWYARSEGDILLYGQGLNNVIHLGDWLVDAFPMARGQRPETLTLGDDAWNTQSLDRTIQNIQTYQRVFSSRLHHLLCAMTSAEQVAYREQYVDHGQHSGKFRAMLIDIFGRTFPEEHFFDVDRDAVVSYKLKVRQTMELMRKTFEELCW